MPSNVRLRLVLFYALTYTITWLWWAPFYLPVFPESWQRLPALHLLGTTGPFCGAVLTVLITEGASGCNRFLKRIFSKGKWSYAVPGLLAPFAIVLAAQLLAGNGVQNPFTVDRTTYSGEFGNLHPLVWIIGVNIITYGMGEEGGWRGYATPQLQKLLSPLSASIILAFLWAIWHWPLFFYPLGGFYTMSTENTIGWVFSLIAGSMLISWIFNASRGSVAACALFHGAMDVAFAGGRNTEEMLQYVGIVVTLLGIAAGIALYKKRHSYHKADLS